MARLSAFVVHETLSASGTKKFQIRLPKLPLKCREIEISSDQDVSFTADFVQLVEYVVLDDTGYSKTNKTIRIQGDLQLKANVGDFFLLQSDPLFNFTNNASVTAKLLIKIIPIEGE